MARVTITDTGAVLLLGAALVPRRWLRLYRNDVDVSPVSLLSDFEVCTFPDYADQEITSSWSAPILDPFGRAVSTVLGLTFTRGAGGVPETVYGWVLYENESPDSVMIAGRRFNVPVPIDAEGAAVLVSVAAYLLRG